MVGAVVVAGWPRITAVRATGGSPTRRISSMGDAPCRPTVTLCDRQPRSTSIYATEVQGIQSFGSFFVTASHALSQLSYSPMGRKGRYYALSFLACPPADSAPETGVTLCDKIAAASRKVSSENFA